MPRVDESAAMTDLIARLSDEFPDVRTEDVASIVNNQLTRFDDSRIREFVPLFVERRTRATLSQLKSALSWSS